MFNSRVLEVAIGLIFCFGAVSLIVSSVNEAIASMLKLRGRTLLKGIGQILNTGDNDNLLLALYNHAAINPHTYGDAKTVKELGHMPSYIDSKNFAVALTDILQNSHPGQDLAEAIGKLPDGQVKAELNRMYSRANGAIEQFEGQLEQWFNNGMDRLSGSYKRKSQVFTVAIAFCVAALFNIDFFHLFSSLWSNPTLAQGITADSGKNANTLALQMSLLAPPKLPGTSDAANKDAASDAIPHAANALPVGWTDARIAQFRSGWYIMLAGWVVTALTALFGAPFWFDLLQRAVNLRGAGPKNSITSSSTSSTTSSATSSTTSSTTSRTTSPEPPRAG